MKYVNFILKVMLVVSLLLLAYTIIYNEEIETEQNQRVVNHIDELYGEYGTKVHICNDTAYVHYGNVDEVLVDWILARAYYDVKIIK